MLGTKKWHWPQRCCATLSAVLLHAACSSEPVQEDVATVAQGVRVAGKAAGQQPSQALQDLARDRYIVVFKPSSFRGQSAQRVPDVASAMHKDFGARPVRVFEHALQGMAVQLPEKATLTRIKNDPRVAYVIPDNVISINSHTDPSWNLDRIDQVDYPLDNEYNHQGTGQDVHVYVIDTGVNASHEEFAGRVRSGYDILDNDPDPDDCNGHGTHVAGVVLGETFGVAKDAYLHAVKVLDCQGYTLASHIIAGIDWVTANHTSPAVVNMSLGDDEYNQAIQDAVSASVAAGIPYVVAAGNNSGDACEISPAAGTDVLTVAATDRDPKPTPMDPDAEPVTDLEAGFTNWGTCVDLYAPGVDIPSAWIGAPDATDIKQGTSQASPHVTGAVALLLGQRPNLSPSQIYAEVLAAATPDVIDIEDPSEQSPNLLLNVANLDVPSASHGKLLLDSNVIACGHGLEVTVKDADLAGSVSVDVALTTSADSETLTLTETPVGSGNFAAVIGVGDGPPSSGDGIVQGSDGEAISATYADSDDGSGNPATVTGEAMLDCSPPVISDVAPRSLHTTWAELSYDISEIAHVTVDVGTSCADLSLTTDESAASPPQNVFDVGGLTPDTTYYFSMTAEDRVGNTATYDNAGSCFTFTTAPAIFFEDFESGLDGWNDDGSSLWHVTSGCSAALGGHTQASALYYGIDGVCNYEGSNGFDEITSPEIAVNFDENPYLRFNYLIDTEPTGTDVVDVFLVVNGVRRNQQIATTWAFLDGTEPLLSELETWHTHTQPLGSYAEGEGTVQFVFRFFHNSTNNPNGVYIDDVSVEIPPEPPCDGTAYQAETMYHSTGGEHPGGWNLWTDGYVAFNHTFDGGLQEMVVSAAAEFGDGWPHMLVTVGGTPAFDTTVTSPSSTDWSDYPFTFNAPTGNAEVRVYFTNDHYDPDAEPMVDRNLFIDKVTVADNSCGPEPGSLFASLDVYDDWGTGYCARVEVTNLAPTPTTSWVVLVDSGDSFVNQRWNAGWIVGTGTHTIYSLPWNAAISTNATYNQTGFCALRFGSSSTLPVVVSAAATY